MTCAFDMIVDRFIFKTNHAIPCFTFIPKTGVELSRTGGRFYCASFQNDSKFFTKKYLAGKIRFLFF